MRQGEQAVVRMPQQPWRCVVLENEDTTDKLRRGPFSTSCVHCYYLGIEEVNTKLSNHVKTASLRFRGGGIGVCVPRYPSAVIRPILPPSDSAASCPSPTCSTCKKRLIHQLDARLPFKYKRNTVVPLVFPEGKRSHNTRADYLLLLLLNVVPGAPLGQPPVSAKQT